MFLRMLPEAAFCSFLIRCCPHLSTQFLRVAPHHCKITQQQEVAVALTENPDYAQGNLRRQSATKAPCSHPNEASTNVANTRPAVLRRGA